MLTKGPTDFEYDIVSQHFEYLERLLERRLLVLAGRTLNEDESGFGIVVFAAESEEVADGIMKNDPAVKNGVLEAVLFPYKVALYQADLSEE